MHVVPMPATRIIMHVVRMKLLHLQMLKSKTFRERFICTGDDSCKEIFLNLTLCVRIIVVQTSKTFEEIRRQGRDGKHTIV